MNTWSPHREAKLIKLWEEGLSASKIAEAIGPGVTRCAVVGKAHRLKLSPRPSPIKLKSLQPERKSEYHVRRGPRRLALSFSGGFLKNEGCQWPSGHGPSNWTFCGKLRVEGYPYCAHHKARAFQPSKAKL